MNISKLQSKNIFLIIFLFSISIFLVIFIATKVFKNYNSIFIDNSFPDISYFKSNPTDIFLLNDSDYNFIESSTPFMGNESSCPHTGGHINFVKNNAPYEVAIISPVDGIVSRIEKCFNLGTHDKFDISIEFAKYKGAAVSLDYSIEPFDGLRCQTNQDYYKKYILVELGQKIKAGEQIAIMPKFSNNPESGTHIHFNLSAQGKMVCPNIFNQKIIGMFSSKYMSGACNRNPINEQTFCYLPGEGENIVDQ